jgi:hypothetical protein
VPRPRVSADPRDSGGSPRDSGPAAEQLAGQQ